MRAEAAWTQPQQAVYTPDAPAVAPTSPALRSATTTNFANSTPVAITDGATTTSTLTVSGAGNYLYDVDLQTFITHTFPGGKDITITSPAGTVVTLTIDNASGFLDNVYNETVWDDDANPAGQIPYK